MSQFNYFQDYLRKLDERKLDKASAEKLFGFEVGIYDNYHGIPGTTFVCRKGAQSSEFPLPKYSTDIKDAMIVWEHLRRSGRWCCLNISSDYHYVYDLSVTEAEREGVNPDHVVTHKVTSVESLPRGICLLALKAEGVDI